MLIGIFASGPVVARLQTLHWSLVQLWNLGILAYVGANIPLVLGSLAVEKRREVSVETVSMTF